MLIPGHRHPSREIQKYGRAGQLENDSIKVERRSLEIYERYSDERRYYYKFYQS